MGAKAAGVKTIWDEDIATPDGEVVFPREFVIPLDEEFAAVEGYGDLRTWFARRLFGAEGLNRDAGLWGFFAEMGADGLLAAIHWEDYPNDYLGFYPYALYRVTAADAGCALSLRRIIAVNAGSAQLRFDGYRALRAMLGEGGPARVQPAAGHDRTVWWDDREKALFPRKLRIPFDRGFEAVADWHDLEVWLTARMFGVEGLDLDAGIWASCEELGTGVYVVAVQWQEFVNSIPGFSPFALYRVGVTQVKDAVVLSRAAAADAGCELDEYRRLCEMLGRQVPAHYERDKGEPVRIRWSCGDD